MLIHEFMQRHFKHFNAKTVLRAAEGWIKFTESGGAMFLTLAGAMSTAELGISLAPLIREGFIDAICCTGANLEEDVYNLIAHTKYRNIPEYRSLKPEEDKQLCEKGLNRVTDTCIPEGEAIRIIEKELVKLWKLAEDTEQRYFPYEYIYQLFENKTLDPYFEIDTKNSWLYAAWQKGLPIFTPGWEDSTCGNIFAAHLFSETVTKPTIVKSGIEQMMALISWYKNVSNERKIGFFQIGGGIAGDFPICVVPLIRQDLQESCPLWGYFCQIGDSTTSYGSYSGATPNEKISWGKLDINTPSYMIESDATIVAPLIFTYVLEKGGIKHGAKLAYQKTLGSV